MEQTAKSGKLKRTPDGVKAAKYPGLSDVFDLMGLRTFKKQQEQMQTWKLPQRRIFAHNCIIMEAKKY